MNTEYPIELDFLEAFYSAEMDCVEYTDAFSVGAGVKLPETVVSLGTLLSTLFRISTCADHCNGGSHHVEWLVGRVTNQSAAAIRLIRSGYYDDALSIIRAIGEMGNLLTLFSNDNKELESWLESDSKQRRNKYSPSAVRKKLTSSTSKPLIDEERYWKLCEIGVHPVPHLAPGHFSGTGRAAIGPVFQQVGVNVCFTELAMAVSVCGLGVVSLFPHNKETQEVLASSSFALAKSIGSFNILNYERLIQEVRDNQSA